MHTIRTNANPTMDAGADPYERIAAAIREALPGDRGDRLLESIVEELAEVAGRGGDDAAALYARLRLEFERVAATDTATGLPNRARFMEDLNRCIAAAVRYGEPLGLLVAQIDDGPDEDDERTVGEALLRLVRVSDVVARIAPGRFALILPRTGAVGAALVAARVSELEGYELALGNATLTADLATADELLALAEASLGERPSRDS